MNDKIDFGLFVGTNENGEIVINNSLGQVVLSPIKARRLAESLTKHANAIEHEARKACFSNSAQVGSRADA
mgnify:CR=1 FL=1